MQDIFEKLKGFLPKKVKNYYEITIPVVMAIDGGLLDLKIKPISCGYKISFERNLFIEANMGCEQELYFKIFKKYDNNFHYDIKIKNGKIFKDYTEERSIVTAIDEFVRFFIKFDNFFINNNVVGHEEDFVI